MAVSGAQALGAQPLTFQEALVDAGASGDDKIVADIDLDGFADGVVGGSSLDWWHSNGAARSFVKYHLRNAAVEFTTDMDAADVDGDGDIDLVYADGPGANNVKWLENPLLDPPAGTPPDPTVGANWTVHDIGSHGGYAHDIETGFIDGFAGLDVVTLGNGWFKIHFQDAAGWTTVDFAQFADDGSPAVADIDGDGDSDLFVRGGWIQNPPSGRRNPNNWTFHAIDASDPGDGPATAAIDIDRDGRPDLVTCPQHNASGALAWFRSPADPTQSAWPRHVIAAAAGSHHLRVADFDGDARPDLLTGLELAAGNITVWRNVAGSPPTFVAYPVATGGGGHNAAAGDLDGNGLPDVWSADFIGNPPLKAYFNGPDVLFRDGFESGDTSRWTSTTP